jgi:hypothetical protein
MSTKIESAVLNAPKLTENPLLVTDSTISISKSPNYVNSYYMAIFLIHSPKNIPVKGKKKKKSASILNYP